MSADIKKLQRIFKHGQLMLDDPGPDLSPEEVMTIYAEVYPALTNASVEGPEYTEESVVYSFRTSVGTKGIIHEEDHIEFSLEIAKTLKDLSDGEEVILPPSSLQELTG